jgi:hypothetical protein
LEDNMIQMIRIIIAAIITATGLLLAPVAAATPGPTPNPFPPPNATAMCCDGTYSPSQHRSGTCSHHNGVCQWCPCNPASGQSTSWQDADNGEAVALRASPITANDLPHQA